MTRPRALTSEWWDKPLNPQEAVIAIALVFISPFLVAFLFLVGFLIWGRA